MKRKKRNGTRTMRTLSLAAILLASVLPVQASKKKGTLETYALIVGTVFSASGYALPDANVTLTPDPQPDSAPLKIKKLQVVSDSRGEFAFRVPPGAMHYIVGASAKGYRAAQKPVIVQGEDRVDISFQLDPEAK